MNDKTHQTPKIQRVIAIFWPSFLIAGLATIFVFAAFDPAIIFQVSGYGEISRMAGYSLGFFFFWLVTASACILTCYFQRPCHNNNC